METIILKPENMAKVAYREPVILASASGLLSISQAAREMINQDRFFFVHIPEEKTTYLVPSPDGFVFRDAKGRKGLALNHSALSRRILEMNGGGAKLYPIPAHKICQHQN